ncbi:MAG: hypothetical protein AAFU85_23745 [Planctomycetota bacterium]
MTSDSSEESARKPPRAPSCWSEVVVAFCLAPTTPIAQRSYLRRDFAVMVLNQELVDWLSAYQQRAPADVIDRQCELVQSAITNGLPVLDDRDLGALILYLEPSQRLHDELVSRMRKRKPLNNYWWSICSLSVKWIAERRGTLEEHERRRQDIAKLWRD